MSPIHALRRSVLSLALLVPCVPAFAGDVVVVAPLGGDGVALLHAALAAAADGDVILLRAGNYLAPDNTPFVIDGKGVSVVVDEGHGPLFARGFTVTDTPPGSLVVLRGLELRAWDPGDSPTDLPLRARDVMGSLWVEDCVLQGEHGVFDGTTGQQVARPAAVLERCAAVSIERCTLRGGDGLTAPTPQAGFSDGASGLVLRETSLTMHDSTLQGGDAGDNYLSGSAPGDGLRVTEGSWAILSGCSATGGDIQVPGFSPKPAGDGVQVLADGSKLWLRGTTLTAGTGQGTNPPGLPVNAPAGAVKTYRGAAAGARMPAVVRVGTSVTLDLVDGRPGDAAFVLLSLGGGFLPVPELRDGLVLDAGNFVGPVFLGSLDGNGDLSLTVTAPFLGAAIDGLPVLVQSAFSGFGGYTALGAGTSFHLVQTAF